MAVRIEFEAITGDLVKGFRVSGREGEKLERILGKTAKESLNVREAALRLERAQVAAARAADKHTRDHIKYASAALRAERAQERLTRELRDATGASARLASAEQRLAAAHARTAAARTKAVGSAKSMSSSLVTMTRRATAAGAAVAGIGGAAAMKSAVSFEQQMSKVQAKLLISRREMGGLNRLAMDLGARTQFSAAEAAQAMDELAAQGFTANRIFKVLPGTLDLAAASGTDMANAARIQTETLHQFWLEADRAGKVADVLAQISNRSAADIDSMQESLKYVGPVANAAGQTLEQVGAAIGLMANAGIKGSQAGTSLRTAMVRLQDPTEPVSDALRNMGLEARDLYGPRGLQPLPVVIGKIARASEGMGKAQQNAALSSIFGREALSGMVTLVARGERALRRETKALVDSEGASRRAANIMRNNVAGAWDNFTGSVETSAIRLTTRFMPSLKQALDRGAGDVNRFTSTAGDFLDGLLGDGTGNLNEVERVGRTVREIADAGIDAADAIRDLTFGVVGFVGEHDELRKLVGTVVALGVAAKAIKFAGAVTGINQMLVGAGKLRRAGIIGPSSGAVAGGHASGRMPRAAASAGVLGAGAAVGGTALGGMIGGPTGSALGGAASGAGLGMIAGPWGAAGGALIGAAASGLIGAVSSAKADERRDEAAAQARRWANSFTNAVAGSVTRGMDPRRARVLADARQGAQRSSAMRFLDAQIPRADGWRVRGPGGMVLPSRGFTRAERAQVYEGRGPVRVDPRLLAQARAEGRRVVDAFLAGQGRKFTTGRYLLQDFRAEFGRLPGMAQQMGATALIRYTRGLERSGRVARGTTEKLIKGIAREFDGLAPRIAGASARTRRALERLAGDERVVNRTRTLVGRLSGQFAQLPRATVRSVQGSAATLRTYLDRLTEIARDRNAPRAMRAAAEKELPALRDAYRRTLGRLADTFGGSRRAADAWARDVSASTRRSSDRAEQVKTLRDEVNRLTGKMRDGSAATEALARQLDSLKGNLEGVRAAAEDMPDLSALGSGAIPQLTLRPPRPRGRRTGGVIRRYAGGGLVPSLVSSGEEIVEPGGRSWIVPGPRVAADNVFAMLPERSKVFTEHGQALRAGGASDTMALARQVPHFARGGVVRGKVSHFGPPGDAVGGMASGQPSSVPGLALNLNPGTDAGWNNPTTQGWISKARKGKPVSFLVQVANRRAVLPLLDLGPAGWTGKAIDITGAGVRRMGMDPDTFPTGKIGTATMVGGDGRLPAGVPGSGGYSYSYLKRPAITRSRKVDLLQPYGAADAFGQGFQSGLEGTRRLFRNWRGVDTEFFKSAIAGVRPNDRDLPKRIRVEVGAAEARGAYTPRNARGAVARAAMAANAIDAKQFAYSSPGDRSTAIPGGPMDCSGSVSKVLIAAGLMSPPAQASPYFKGSWGKPGVGRWITTYSRGGYGSSGHVFMRIGDRYFGTSGQNPGGGAGWHGWPGGSGWVTSHPAGLRRGGVVGRYQGGGVVGSLVGVKAVGAPTARGAPQYGRVSRPSSSSSAPAGLINLIGTEGASSKLVVGQMRDLAHMLETAKGITYNRLGRLREGIHRGIVELMKGGETGRERIQIRRLRGVLTLLEGEMGKRVGLVVGRAMQAVEQISTRQMRTSQRLALRGIDEGSVAGIGALRRDDLRSQRGLSIAYSGRDGQGGLQRELRRARRMRDADAVRTIRDAMRENRSAARELEVSVVGRTRERRSLRADQAAAGITRRVDASAMIRTNVERDLARRGVDAGSAASMFALRDADVQRQGAMQRALGSAKDRTGLYAQLDAARKAKNKDLVQSITETINTYGDEITQLGVDIQVASREAAAQAAAEARAARFRPSEVSAALAGMTRGAGDDIAALQTQRALWSQELATAQATGDSDAIIEAANALAGIESSLQGLKESQRQERYEGSNVRLALAQLTRDTSDDLAALREQESMLGEDLARAQSEGDNDAIIQVANQLAGVQSSIESLDRTLVDRQQADEELKDLIRQQVENQRILIAASQTEAQKLPAYLAAALNGSIGGRVGLGSQTPFFAGQGPRY